jgi:hypothetical protein
MHDIQGITHFSSREKVMKHVFFLILGGRALAELGLTNSNWPSHEDDSDFGKKTWFVHLESAGVKSGFQLDMRTGLCPFATHPHTLRTPTCLKHKYAIFVGDSTMRELAWSFSRLASTDGTMPCQQVDDSTNGRFRDTRIWLYKGAQRDAPLPFERAGGRKHGGVLY